jgi:hypothetical protein
MEVTEREREGGSTNRRGGSELDASVASVPESNNEHSSAEERRGGAGERRREWARGVTWDWMGTDKEPGGASLAARSSLI